MFCESWCCRKETKVGVCFGFGALEPVDWWIYIDKSFFFVSILDCMIIENLLASSSCSFLIQNLLKSHVW